MERSKGMTIAALAAMAVILGITAWYMFRPGGYIEIPELPEATLAPATDVEVTSGGGKYHRQGCSALRKSQETEVISREEAETRGYAPCQKCAP